MMKMKNKKDYLQNLSLPVVSFHEILTLLFILF